MERRGRRAVTATLRRVALAASVLGSLAAGDLKDTPEMDKSARVDELACATEARGLRGVVVANTREAAEAGARVLRRGGNAVDAAVATAFALGISETEASGLGGQAWMLIHRAGGDDVAIDGSGVAPAQFDIEQVRRLRDGAAPPVGYASIATPGGLAALDLALRAYGTMHLDQVIEPALEVANEGVRLTLHQQAILVSFGLRMRSSPPLRDVFLDGDGEPWGPGHLYCLDEVAATLRRLARRGVADFYAGRTADAIDADMRANGGFVRKSDLERIRPVVLPPVRGRFRGYDVIASPAPAGGPAIVEALQILDRFPREAIASDATDAIVTRVEAARIAVYDYLAAWCMGPGYLERTVQVGHAISRAGMIDPSHAATVRAILGRDLVLRRRDGTSQVSVIDSQGNAVSLTVTFHGEFGACVATPGLGFPYNNTLATYDLEEPRNPDYLRPGAVVRNLAAPTMLLRDGSPFLVLGGPGSGRVTSSIVETVVNVVDRRMGAADAVSSARVLWNGGSGAEPFIEVAPPFTDRDVAELNRRGFKKAYALTFPARVIDLIAFGGVNLAMLDPTTGELVGAGDPRRAGTAVVADSP